MKKKILSIILSFTMIFSTTGFAFADTDLDNPPAESVKVEKEVKTEDSSQEKIEKEEPQKEEVKQEENKQKEIQNKEEPQNKEESQKEEVKQEEPQKETQVQEVKKVTKENKVLEEKITEPIVADESQTKKEVINYPIEITWSIEKKSNSGVTSSAKIVHKITSNSNRKFITVNNNTVKIGNTVYTTAQTYTINNTEYNFEYWDIEYVNRPNSEKIYVGGTDCTSAVDIKVSKNTTISIKPVYDAVEPEFIPYTVSYNVYYRSAGHGQEDGWVLACHQNIEVTNDGITHSWPGVQNAYNAMVDNNVSENDAPILYDKKYYTFNKKWNTKKDGTGESYTINSALNGKEVSETTTINIYAQYNEKEAYDFSGTYVDNIQNTKISWGSVNGSGTTYTHTFKDPGNITQYQFNYWQDENNDKKYAGDQLPINKLELDEDTSVIYFATYNFQPSVKVVYHYENGNTYATESYKQPIDIYTSASVQNIDWYYNLSDKNPIIKGTKAELPDVIPDVTEPQIDEPVVVDVYEKTKEEPIAPINPDPINLEPTNLEPTPDPVVPGKITADKLNTTKAKVKTNNTNEAVYYGMGDGDFTITKQPSFIKKNPLPLNLSQQDYWALLNLIFAIATCVLAFLLIIFGILNKKDEDENIEVKNKWWIRIITVFIGIISLIIFFLTENMNNPWVWIDNWTLLMVIIFIINIILMITAKHKEKEKEE